MNAKKVNLSVKRNANKSLPRLVAKFRGGREVNGFPMCLAFKHASSILSPMLIFQKGKAAHGVLVA